MSDAGPLLLGFVCVSLLSVGHLALHALGLGWRRDALAWAGWCAAVGAAAISISLALCWWVAPESYGPLTAWGVPLAWIGGLGLLTRRQALGREVLAGGSTISRVLVAALALGLTALLLEMLAIQAMPSLDGDSAFLFGLKAQAIREAPGLGAAFEHLLERPVFYHRDYPLGVPVMRAWVQALAGAPTFFADRWPSHLLAISLVLALAGALRRASNAWIAASLLLAVLAAEWSAPMLARAQGEAPLALGLLIAGDAAGRARREGDGAWWGLAGCGAALALLAKNEGRLWVLCLVIGLLLTAWSQPFPRPHRRAWFGLGAAVAAAAFTLSFNAWHGFSNDLMSAKGEGTGVLTRLIELGPERLAIVVRYLVVDVLMAEIGGAILLVTVLAALVLYGSARRSVHLATVVALVLGLSGLVLIYLTTPQPLEWHLATSAQRVAWQWLPTASIALAGLLGERGASAA